MAIKILTKNDESDWDRFISGSSDSSIFQQIAWKRVVEDTYRHQPYYLFAEENNQIVGILPLFFINSLLFGKRLVSVPYAPYAGCCSESPIITENLLLKAREIAKQHNVKHIELRNISDNLDYPTNDKHVTMQLNLSPGEDKVWSGVRKGMKACVKKAEKGNFSFHLDSKDLKGFYLVYCKRMHELGTPVPPFAFFMNVSKNFPDMKIATIDCQGEILATQLLIYFKKTVIYAWGASTNKFSEYHPVHALLWKVIQKSIMDGYEIFDFGRSAIDSGTYDFKKWWGAEPKPLYYQYILNKGQEIPYVHPSNPRYKLMIKIWQSLPLPLVNFIGPYGSRELI